MYPSFISFEEDFLTEEELLFLAGASGGNGNLLDVSVGNEKRMSDSWQNWETVGKTVVISGQARGGYYATVQPGTYTFSWVADFGDSVNFAMRVWKDPTESSLGTLIVDQSNIHEKTFTIEGEEPVTIVCGFYCGSTFGAQGHTLSDLRLVEA